MGRIHVGHGQLGRLGDDRHALGGRSRRPSFPPADQVAELPGLGRAGLPADDDPVLADGGRRGRRGGRRNPGQPFGRPFVIGDPGRLAEQPRGGLGAPGAKLAVRPGQQLCQLGGPGLYPGPQLVIGGQAARPCLGRSQPARSQVILDLQAEAGAAALGQQGDREHASFLRP